MANFGDPRVKEWMRTHAEEVQKVQERYDELKELSLSELAGLAEDEGVDVSKVKDKLITVIIAKGG